MGDRNIAAAILTRKRGHQHHPRQSGTRRSNVPAVEVIAALRGDATPQLVQLDNNHCPPNQNIDIIDNNNTAISIGPPQILHTNILSNIDVNNRSLDVLNVIATISNDSDNSSCTIAQSLLKRTEATSLTVDDEEIGSISTDLLSDIPVIKKIRKSKTKSSQSDQGNGGGSSSSTSNSNKTKSIDHKRKKKQAASCILQEERPPLEGAAACDDPDIENDPETAEWSKLRCTSERAEVVAEREYRRQNRRCADYPGLAFGRSIFSSDTMMKFNIIRNELHNIMNTQLKRVRLVEHFNRIR